ncbi:hypothetical protein JCM3774_002739 [Rhodotorula dairenensis]
MCAVRVRKPAASSLQGRIGDYRVEGQSVARTCKVLPASDPARTSSSEPSTGVDESAVRCQAIAGGHFTGSSKRGCTPRRRRKGHPPERDFQKNASKKKASTSTAGAATAAPHSNAAGQSLRQRISDKVRSLSAPTPKKRRTASKSARLAVAAPIADYPVSLGAKVRARRLWEATYWAPIPVGKPATAMVISTQPQPQPPAVSSDRITTGVPAPVGDSAAAAVAASHCTDVASELPRSNNGASLNTQSTSSMSGRTLPLVSKSKVPVPEPNWANLGPECLVTVYSSAVLGPYKRPDFAVRPRVARPPPPPPPPTGWSEPAAPTPVSEPRGLVVASRAAEVTYPVSKTDTPDVYLAPTAPATGSPGRAAWERRGSNATPDSATRFPDLPQLGQAAHTLPETSPMSISAVTGALTPAPDSTAPATVSRVYDTAVDGPLTSLVSTTTSGKRSGDGAVEPVRKKPKPATDASKREDTDPTPVVADEDVQQVGVTTWQEPDEARIVADAIVGGKASMLTAYEALAVEKSEKKLDLLQVEASAPPPHSPSSDGAQSTNLGVIIKKEADSPPCADKIADLEVQWALTLAFLREHDAPSHLFDFLASVRHVLPTAVAMESLINDVAIKAEE